MDFGPKAPTPTALKQPTHTQKSTHQQRSVSCANLKKKLLVNSFSYGISPEGWLHDPQMYGLQQGSDKHKTSMQGLQKRIKVWHSLSSMFQVMFIIH